MRTRIKLLLLTPVVLSMLASKPEAILHSPGTDVFVLANHGLIIGAPDCDSDGSLLNEVEKRVAAVPKRAFSRIIHKELTALLHPHDTSNDCIWLTGVTRRTRGPFPAAECRFIDQCVSDPGLSTGFS
jgi:hypothetical protein